MSVAAKKSQLKIPPQNLEAEQAVLGSLLIDKNAMIKIADFITPKDFYNPANEKICDIMFELYEKHQPIDIMTLTSRLKERDLLKDIGGSAYLADLTNQVATASHVESYAKIVKEKRVLRDLVRAAGDIAEAVFDPDKEAEDILDDIEQKILAISQQSLPQNFLHISGELKAAYERIEKLHAGEGKFRGVPTGFTDLDNLLSGLQKSDLVVIGARPSLGKTAFSLDIARHVALKAQVPVGIFSLEMSRDQVIDRIISAESQVPLWRILTGRITDDTEFQMIQGALDRLSHASIYIDDSPILNIMQMRSMARRLQIEHGLGLIIVDYLQLISPRRNFESMVQQVTEISRGLKALARELKVPVIALSQLSRDVDKRELHVPRLSDLRDSGSIEQDSDVVMFLHRKDRDQKVDLPPEEQNVAQIIIAKHRNGAIGQIQLKFDPERVSFKNMESRYGNGLPA